jgi:hypothetical protein
MNLAAMRTCSGTNSRHAGYRNADAWSALLFFGLFGEPNARALVFGKDSDSSSLKGYGSKFFVDSTTK